MSDLYYLFSSLPFLFFDEEPGIKIEIFINAALPWLNYQEQEILLDFTKNKNLVKHKLAQEIIQFKTELKKAVIYLKNNQKEMIPLNMIDFSAHILNQENPLLREKTFEKIKWDFLNALEKLKILERLIIFKHQEKGLEKFLNFEKMVN